MLDPDALTGMPVLIGANAGTARHSLAIDYAIRPLFAYLHADAVSTGVFAASSDWGSAADQVAPLSARVDKGARELAEAIARREPARSTDPFDPENYVGSFQRLMGGDAASGGGHLLGGLAGEEPARAILSARRGAPRARGRRTPRRGRPRDARASPPPRGATAPR